MQTSTALFPFPAPPTIDHPPYLQTPSSSLSSTSSHLSTYSYENLHSACRDAFALSTSQLHYPQAIPKYLQTDLTTPLPNACIKAQNSAPTLLPHHTANNFFHSSASLPQSGSCLPVGRDRQMYTASLNSMGGSVTQNSRGIKRQRTHQRTPSASTVASNGPDSPYMLNGSHPQVANTDISPHSPAYYADQSFAKHLPTPSQTPTELGFANTSFAPQFVQVPNAHLAMKDFAIQHHSESDFTSDFAPSRQSMSSYENDSPATPQSGVADLVDMKAFNGSTNDVRPPNPNVQLFRTESQAYQDELYNPNTYTSAPATSSNTQSQHNFLLPHRNLMAERLQTANMARSTSPMSAVSRERSPFRDGSPLAPTKDWTSPQAVGTVASMRQQQKQEAEDAEYARHTPQLRREQTKTISPKDALLEFHDADAGPLFQDSVPAGYDTHRGGTEQWTANYNAFGGLPITSQQNMGFRHATPAETNLAESGFNFDLPQENGQIQINTFQADYSGAVANKMNNHYDNPHFPPQLPSMETSASDPGAGLSSQEESSASVPQRPDDTRANTGTYTCTYHGCTQRFDSHANLQKHKREYHRVQQQQSVAASESGNGSQSPRSSQSPGPSGSGLSQADLMARNSQAGPHKCTRINPSTSKPCNTVFSRPYDLTRHEDTIHNNRKQKVKCQYCREDKTFSRNDALTRHMRVVHPEVSETYPPRRGRRGD